MEAIEKLLAELDDLSKVEIIPWFKRNRAKLIFLILETENHELTIETISQYMGNKDRIKGQIKQELASGCRLEIKKRYDEKTKETLNINISEAHTNKKGELIADYHNLLLIGQTELWDKIRFDNFTGEVKVLSPLPWHTNTEESFKERTFQDFDTTEAVAWYNSFNINPRYNDVGHVLFALAMRNSFDGYQKFMDAKPKWDGKRRLNTWLFRYCGSWPRDQSEWRIISAYGRKLFLSMVARCYDPGCMARLIFMFEGEQNVMKTLLVEAIGDPYYVAMSGRNLDLTKSDSHSILNGAAMVEIPENILGKRNDIDTLKGYFSQKVSKIRLPYGHHHIEMKRRNVFAITLNLGADRSTFNDPTGGTRFCSIEVGVNKSKSWKIDLDGFIAVRDQLFAEAIHCYRNGEKWWLNLDQEELQRTHVATRNVENPSEFFVCKYLALDPRYKNEGVSVDCIIQSLSTLNGCPRFSRQLISEALKSLGFEQDRFTLTDEEKKVVTSSTRQVRLWFLKGTKNHITKYRQDYNVSMFKREVQM